MSTQTLSPILKHFTPAEINFTPGERSFVAWITTDIVDNEGDVVVAGGVDTKAVFMGVPGDPSKPGNPVVMSVHDYKRWPLGTCEWIKHMKASARTSFNGLYAKTLIDEEPDAIKVFGMIQRRVVRGISIGFRPPDDAVPGDWGPPTRAELDARPDWKNARRIIRRCVLLEYSVVPIPMNQASLIFAVSKGLDLPSYLKDKVKAMPIVVHDETRSQRPWTVLDAKGERILSAHETKDDAETARDNGGFTVGQHVKCMGGMKSANPGTPGCGVIKSLHPDGNVDADGDYDDDRAERSEPAALVDMHDKEHKCYGQMKAMACKSLEPLDEGSPDDVEGVTGASDKGASGQHTTTKGAVPYHGYPETDAAWDASAARREFKEHAQKEGAEGENDLDFKKYGEGFACFTGSGDKEGDYKFPHHCIVGGAIKTSRQGVASAIAACHGARSGGTPEGSAEAMGHLMKHARALELPIAEDGKSLDWAALESATGWTFKALTASSGTAGGYVVPPDDEAEKDMDGGDMETESADDLPMIKKGDRVEFGTHKGTPAGVGVVKSVHTAGKVPGVVNEAEASDEEPHARVERYKHMGHPFDMHASGEHVAVPTHKCKILDTMRLHSAGKTDGKSYGGRALVSGAADEPFMMHDRPPQSAGVVAFKSGPAVERVWNEANALARIKAFASGDAPRYRKAFAWFDERRPADAKACWGLHHDIVSGRLSVNVHAVKACLAALDAADIPDGDKPAIREHLEKHLAEASAEQEAEPVPPPAAPAPPTEQKTAADYERELVARLAATGTIPANAESQVETIFREVENRLYGVIE